MKYQRSSQLFKAASEVIPGGVNSPVRAFKAVGGTPVFVDKAKGAYLYDADGNRLIDYINSWGPMILGHAFPPVIDAVVEKAKLGTSFGMPTEIETQIAELAVSMVPNVDQIRFVNSGTEACMSAVRLARGFSGKEKIIKFAGCYHGHSDSFLIQAGSGAVTFGSPNSPGVTKGTAKDTLLATYNDLESVTRIFEANPSDIACVIVEPVAGNMGCIPPHPGFLKGLRDLCDANQSILVFDEVMTGFRISQKGAIGYYGIDADLICLGKVIGGGMPVGAFGGKREIMEQIAPLGPVYQAGTLSGNPVAMAAGLATLNLISQPGFLDPVSARTTRLVEGLCARAAAAGIPMTSNHVGTMWGIFFSDEQKIINYSQVMQCDTERFAKFFHGMLEEGVYLAPASFEAGFMSAAHTDEDIQNTLEAAERVFTTL